MIAYPNPSRLWYYRVNIQDSEGNEKVLMSKVAQYLNEHLLGEVSNLTSLRASYARDQSVFDITPEIVVFPKVTNDIRKVARFSWQLAEKGHTLSLTPRGLGTDTTGGAIGSGILIDLSRHLNSILYVSTKDKNKIVHVQPGVALRTLHETLKWQGLTIGAYTPDVPDMTVGGAIAAGSVGRTSGKYGTVADAIERMEVVLANGDLMETGRINKRELSRKKGEQTLEGEIYRQVDGIIDDNTELIASLSSDNDNLGYRIDKVKDKDGSFDLTPLFIGSQGTLGIISEVVLKTDFYSDDESVLVVVCKTAEEARDITDVLRQLDPTVLEVIDGTYYEEARERGKRFIFDSDSDSFAGLVYASFDDFSDKARTRKLKKAAKLLSRRDAKLYTSEDSRLEDLYAVRDVEQSTVLPQRVDESPVFMCDSAYIPAGRLEDFIGEVATLAEKLHVKLPLKVNVLTGIVSTYPTVHFKKVSDKQKVFKLATEYAALVHKAGGTIAGAQAEGRINAFAGYAQLDEAVVDLNASIRKVFDPFRTLNPGVKQSSDLKVLARQLRSE